MLLYIIVIVAVVGLVQTLRGDKKNAEKSFTAVAIGLVVWLGLLILVGMTS